MDYRFQTKFILKTDVTEICGIRIEIMRYLKMII